MNMFSSRLNKDMKEKQIEEMAKVMCGGCHNGEECMRCLCADWYRAEMLYNAGYRKIDKGSVVLTEEEFNELRQTIITQSQEYTKICNEINALWFEAWNKSRKQAVRELIEKINEKLCTFKLVNKNQEFVDGYTEAIAEVCGRLDEIAKEFGV